MSEGDKRCFCGSALRDIIVKDGGSRYCLNSHKVLPCMLGIYCKKKTRSIIKKKTIRNYSEQGSTSCA
jgi:hypothetical protein